MQVYFIGLFHKVESRLDGIAMYRIVSLALLALATFAILLGFLGLIPYTGTEQVISLAIALLVAQVTNFACSLLWRVPVNNESANITALILFFLVLPAQFSSLEDSYVIATVTFLAIVSKFIFAWRKQHLVNPAAIGVVLLALSFDFFPFSGYFESSWWIGIVEMFVPLIVLGTLVVMKLRKWTPVLSFFSVAFVVFLFEEWRFGGDLALGAQNFWLSGPSLFLAFFMLTEPFTMPPSKRLQMFYGAFVGFISQTTIFMPLFKITPELALVVGNLLFYPSTLKRKLILPLREIKEVAKNTLEFAFEKPTGLIFKAGQYLEWTLAHTNCDERGVRRYFTIASSPTDSLLRISVRFADNVSSYKNALRAMKVGEKITASQLAGDFVLPKDTSKKLGLIAGGIGITPFMSQIGYIKDTNAVYDVNLFYCNNTLNEIAYKNYLDDAKQKISLKVVHVLAKEQIDGCEFGYVTGELIKKHSPDYLTREWYLSGPPSMVNAYFKLLQEMGVSRKNIKRDFFPGLS